MSIKPRLLALLSIFLLITGCAPMSATHRKTPDGLKVSVSDEGLNNWTDVGGHNGRVHERNVFVSGSDTNGYFFGTTFVDTTKMANQKVANSIEDRFDLELSPRFRSAMVKAAKQLDIPSPHIKEQHDDTVDIQIIPLIEMGVQSQQRLRFSAHILTRFLDAQGERHKRSYAYLSTVVLPVNGDTGSWTGQNNRLLNLHIDRAFEALADTVLRDSRGDFQAEIQSPTPKILKTWRQVVQVQDVLLHQDDGFRVIYRIYGSRPALEFFFVEDLSDPKAWLQP